MHYSFKNLMGLTVLVGFSLFGITFTQAQTPTVGVLHSDPAASEGYMLFTPEKNDSVYLVDNCGQLINQWVFTENPSATCYLLENGNLLRVGVDSLEIRDWNSNLIWSYALMANGIDQHHDIEPLPNGNILCVAHDRYNQAEVVEEGRDPALTATLFDFDKVVELAPSGTNDATIVWEWRFIDHLIQDFDSTKANFGVVENHPELLDANFNNGQQSDWIHVNAIDYNVERDEIILSARHMSEVYVIDHSTTTLEAAGHTGGDADKGGDFLWRWGNPQVYRQGTDQDQKIFKQHDSRWVDPGYLDAGKVSVFNNDGDGSGAFSSVHLIEPEIANGAYVLTNNQFGPQDFDWSWNGSILGNVVDQGKKSGAHSLPNGNFLICESSTGLVSEISKDGTHLWSYRNPSGTSIVDQFTMVSNGLGNGIFRGEKYPPDFPGFNNLDLDPQGLIEDQNEVADSCLLLLSVPELVMQDILVINPNQAGELIFTQPVINQTIRVLDLQGRVVWEQQNFTGARVKAPLDLGVYVLYLSTAKTVRTQKIVVQ